MLFTNYKESESDCIIVYMYIYIYTYVRVSIISLPSGYCLMILTCVTNCVFVYRMFLINLFMNVLLLLIVRTIYIFCVTYN